ncbi:MAG: anti-sigma factor family protein [Armatimonadota bacterium]
MDCASAKELFSDYLEGNIEHNQSALMRKHVEECDSCKREYDAFKQTWSALGAVSEVSVPVNFRHDVLMRMARLQHERNQSAKHFARRSGYTPLVRPLFVARAAALACAFALMAVVVINLPPTRDGVNTGSFAPSIETLTPGSSDTPSLQAVREQQWKSRRLGRNTLWVDIHPDRRKNRATLYRVTLSINNYAIPEEQITARIGAEVYLLPPDSFGPKDVDRGNLVWAGNIIKDSPVVVPVLVDESSNPGDSINLLVQWTFRQRKFAYVLFIPAQTASQRSLDFSISSTTMRIATYGLYATLRNIAQDYGVPLVANAYLEESSSITDLGQRSLDAVLRDTLDPLGLDYLYSHGVVYVDLKYEIPS